MSLETLIFAAFITLTAGLPTPVHAADGPENTGSLTLLKTDSHLQSAALQLDRKVLASVFGEKTSAADVARLIQIKTSASPCTAEPPSTIDEADVVAAVLTYDCSRPFTGLVISLTDATLPPGFTLGVRTPFDHFVLSADARSRATITSGTRVFLRAGLAYLTGGAFLEHARIGRAHALYFGGLQHIPAGFWLLLLVLTVWTTRYTAWVKLLVTAAVVAGTMAIAAFVISKEASLTLIPVRTLAFLSLAALAGANISAWLPTRMSTAAGSVCLFFATLCCGLEHGVILRWLEGQTDLNPWQHAGAFAIGTMLPLVMIILAVAAGLWSAGKLKGAAQKERAPKILALGLLLFCAYTAVALALKVT